MSLARMKEIAEGDCSQIIVSMAYFSISILLGVFHFWHLFSMLRHAGAESNDYFMAGIALLWVSIIVVAFVCLRKKLI